MTPDIYTVPEIAARWRCSVDVVYDLLRRKKLNGFKLGTAWRVTAENLSRYENESNR